MLKKIVTSAVLLAVVHFLLVVLYANGIGGRIVAGIAEFVIQPGIQLSRELGFGGFGLLSEIGGNPVGLWIVMALNSLLWGTVLSAVCAKLLSFIGK